MAAKKPAVKTPEVKVKAKPKLAVKIPKAVSSSTNRVYRKIMIDAIQEQAFNTKYRSNHIKDKD